MPSEPAMPGKRQLVLDAVAHNDTGRIPYMILFQPDIGRRLARHYGVESMDEVVDNAVEWISNALPPARLEEMGLLVDGEHTDEWGIRWHGVGETRGQVKASPLAEPSLASYRFPGAASSEVICQMKAQAEKSAHRYRLAKLGALWEQATFVRGMEELLKALILHPR